MTKTSDSLDEEILHLYQEPVIGSGYSNMFGEENIVKLVEKYCSLNDAGQARMRDLVVGFSESMDLSSSFVSVAVLHALGMESAVQNAYRLASTVTSVERGTSPRKSIKLKQLSQPIAFSSL